MLTSLWFSKHNGGAEHGGKAEDPAEAGEDPAVEPAVHGRQQPARAAADAGGLTQEKDCHMLTQTKMAATSPLHPTDTTAPIF